MKISWQVLLLELSNNMELLTVVLNKPSPFLTLSQKTKQICVANVFQNTHTTVQLEKL